MDAPSHRLDSLPALRSLRRPVPALLLVTAVALLARLWALGWRVAHQDEGRVGHWILQYGRTGTWEYRPIIHGPFIPHVDGVLFSVLGASDFTARLPMAVVGGLLPLTALLLRGRLRDEEVLGLGVLLAVNPVLLYYSRFMRSDLLLAAFAFAAVAFAVRAIDARQARYLYAGAAALALGFTTKENALVYPVAWLGALALVVDHRLLLARETGEAWTDRLWGYAVRAATGLWAWKHHLAVAVVEFLAIVVVFYAPKPALWEALGDPARLPEVVETATLGSWRTFADMWLNTGMQAHPYLTYLGPYLEVLARGALPLCLLAVLGFLYDRYGREEPRALVSFAFYWGAASVLGYPLIVDIRAAWTATHALAPLAVPAAVGLALVYREGRSALADDDRVAAAAAALLLVVAGGGMGYVAVDTSYRNPQGPGNVLVQYAQPSGEMQPALERIREVAAENDGVDVLYFGEKFYNADQDCLAPGSACADLPPASPGWFERLPLPWYLQRYGATVASVNSTDRFPEDPPPVVIALGPGQGEDTSEDVDDRLAGYDRLVYQQYQSGRPLVVYVRDDAGTAG